MDRHVSQIDMAHRIILQPVDVASTRKAIRFVCAAAADLDDALFLLGSLGIADEATRWGMDLRLAAAAARREAPGYVP